MKTRQVRDKPHTYSIIILFLLTVGLNSGCGTLGYYGQSIHGQMEIWQEREFIPHLLRNGEPDQDLKADLEYTQSVRTFATDVLYLPDNNSYRYYANLNRDYIVWNVFATPALSLESKQWCFLIVGCLQYRGYFSDQAARDYARELQSQGLDVFVGGVTAYSTLGWFDDPVTDTMIRRGRPLLAEVIFHELAHQLLFINDDTAFNEAFAETVAINGVNRWLQQQGDLKGLQWYEAMKAQETRFVSLVMSYRERLQALYSSNLSDSHKLAGKAQFFSEMLADYHRQRTSWPFPDYYDPWFEAGLNNAKLAAVVTYREYLPGFQALLASVEGNFARFYDRVRALARCSKAQRRQVLRESRVVFDCS